MNELYNSSDYPDAAEKKAMWNTISTKLKNHHSPPVLFHWKSFWLGNAAAVILLFAVIGIYETASSFMGGTVTQQQEVYEGLNEATQRLDKVAPVILQQANEQDRTSMESTFSAIREIDRLIEELKNEMLINGITPAKKYNLNRLYATKLDFYKELLLINREQS
ncbi:MAG: hypothetical protein FH748_12040 [Balneolaceae bacterium]|nr:hypothetical protein [Balneolaceae bacterium]